MNGQPAAAAAQRHLATPRRQQRARRATCSVVRAPRVLKNAPTSAFQHWGYVGVGAGAVLIHPVARGRSPAPGRTSGRAPRCSPAEQPPRRRRASWTAGPGPVSAPAGRRRGSVATVASFTSIAPVPLGPAIDLRRPAGHPRTVRPEGRPRRHRAVGDQRMPAQVRRGVRTGRHATAPGQPASTAQSVRNSSRPPAARATRSGSRGVRQRADERAVGDRRVSRSRSRRSPRRLQAAPSPRSR